MKYPKISIVTPSFNQAEFLEQTIRSVLDQGYPNLEYIVIDGGSTDGSVEVIKKYADKITYWVSEKDKGQYDAINKGFLHTTGDIMGWINSSDLYYPWTFKFITEIFENLNEVQWLIGMPTNLSTGNAPQRVSVSKERNLYDVIAGDYKWIQQESVFWKRELWEKSGGKLNTSVKYAEDFNLWLRFFKYEHLYYVDTVLAGFRYHDIRRGGDVSGVYVNEAEELYKNYKTQFPFKARYRGFITRLFLRRNNLIRKILKKLGLCSWYKHYNIYYDFYSDQWKTRTR